MFDLLEFIGILVFVRPQDYFESLYKQYDLKMNKVLYYLLVIVGTLLIVAIVTLVLVWFFSIISFIWGLITRL